jgi:hypothetical protein
MNKNASLLKLSVFADKHGISLVSKGECGFGRPCVGFTKNSNYIDYCPIDMSTYDPIPKLEDDRLYPPDSVNAYHKHNCLAVLVDGDDYTKALGELAEWVDHLTEQGEVEVVSYRTGASGMQAMLSGSTGFAVRIK